MYLKRTIRVAAAFLLSASLWAVTPSPASAATTYRGDGDDIITLNRTAVGIAKITYSGEGHFAVVGLDKNGEMGQLLVNDLDGYTGVVPYNTDTGDRLYGLEVTADGPWTIQLLPLSKAKYWAITSRGGTDQVLRLTKTSTGLHTLRVRYTGDGHFAVLALNAKGRYHSLLVNDLDGYNGRVRLPAGTRYVQVDADGPWTMVRK
ncbi:hypothetical protein [Acrocarpospora sp. B8E8]|uniref:hypothetical protein n=1 Tax=Acrocarpospora sp. B8E8 TaxID=3153572 RepID=UPI00325CF179